MKDCFFSNIQAIIDRFRGPFFERLDANNYRKSENTRIDLMGASEKTDVVRDILKLRIAARFAKEIMKGDEAAYMAAVFVFANSQNSVVIPDYVKHVVPIAVKIAHAETSKDVTGVIECWRQQGHSV